MSSITFRDLLLGVVAVVLAIVVLILPHINPVAEGQKTKDMDPPGRVTVELFWPSNIDADLDLWVHAPGDIPVGYSNKGGAVFNLLRDDLGKRRDLSPINYEVSFSNAIVPGRYVVNVHLYRNPSNILPIPVQIHVSVKPENGRNARILQTSLELKTEGQELTAFRFVLNDKGQLVQGSVDAINIPLRSSRERGEL